MVTSDPRLYADLMLHIAQHLHQWHGFPDPLAAQDGDVGVFVGGWVDQPDTALNLVGPWEYERDSDTVPEVRFLIAHRAPTITDVWELQKRVFTALQVPQVVQLTADVELRYCARVVSDPPVPDQNNRMVVVDTYQGRPYRTNN